MKTVERWWPRLAVLCTTMTVGVLTPAFASAAPSGPHAGDTLAKGKALAMTGILSLLCCLLVVAAIVVPIVLVVRRRRR